MHAGPSEDKVRQVPAWRESALFLLMEPDALELWARLRRHFTESQMVELTAAVALENFLSKFNVPFQIESQEFCVLRPPGAPAPP